MVNSIDLIKLFFHSACKFPSIGSLLAKFPCDKIKPGVKLLGLVHSDVISPFIQGLYKATYFVTFLYDAIKRSEIVFLTKKNEILLVFKRSCLYHKKRKKCVRHLHTDEGEESDSHKFTKF